MKVKVEIVMISNAMEFWIFEDHAFNWRSYRDLGHGLKNLESFFFVLFWRRPKSLPQLHKGCSHILHGLGTFLVLPYGVNECK